MKKLEPFALGSVLALFVCLNGAHALAADTDPADREARERYENAVKLYEDGAYDAALVELNRAAELRPSFKIFYNIGQVRFAMHDYAAAMDAYRQYLDKGGDKIPAARRDQVQKELTTLAQRVAKLTIETDVAGAEIFIDDTSVGTTPLSAPVVINSGIRRISARHSDYLPQSRRLSIAGGVQDTIKFALADRAAAAAEPAPVASVPATGAVSSSNAGPRTVPPPAGAVPSSTAPALPAPTSHASEHSVPWLGWALTGAFAAGATVTGVLALHANSSLADDRNRLEVSNADISSKATKVRTLATVTDGLAAAAVIAGGVSLWLTLGSSGGESDASHHGATAKRLQIGLGPSELLMKGAF